MTKEEIVYLIESNPNAKFDLDLDDVEVLRGLTLTKHLVIDQNDSNTGDPMYIEALKDSTGTIYYFDEIINLEISKPKKKLN